MSLACRLFSPLIALSFFVCSWDSSAQKQNKNQKPVLSILSVTSKLDQKWVEQFEKEKNVAIRVDFVANGKEIEPRLRSTPRSWDLILADERNLRKLVLSRMLKPIPTAALYKPATDKPLEKYSNISEEGKMYQVFMADAFGFAWLRSTRKTPLPVQWDWLQDSQKNPLWRGRTHIPASEEFQYRIAAKALNLSPDATQVAGIINWLKASHSHAAPVADRLEMRLLSSEVVAALVWKSEYLALKKLVPNLEFGIPQTGTYFERFGFAYVGEALNETHSIDFLKFVNANRNDFATAAGFVPLTSDVEMESQTKQWSLIEDEIPLPAPALLEIKKLAGAQ